LIRDSEHRIENAVSQHAAIICQTELRPPPEAAEGRGGPFCKAIGP
jgi:hypothetical protein